MKTIPPFRPLFFLFASFFLITLPVHAETTYSYDARHRLISATYTDGRAIAYSYDVTSNRLSEIMTEAPDPNSPNQSPPSGTSYNQKQSASQQLDQTTGSLLSQTGESPDQTNYGSGSFSASGQDDETDAAENTKIIREDAEDGTTNRWVLEDGPAWAYVYNTYDHDRGSQVIEVRGDGLYSEFKLTDQEGKDWNDSQRHVIQWSMRYSNDFVISVAAQTSQGLRYVSFTPAAENGPVQGMEIFYGLDEDSRDGAWRTYVVDLNKAVQHAQPGNTVLSVSGFYVSGNGLLDDICSFEELPKGLTEIQVDAGLYEKETP